MTKHCTTLPKDKITGAIVNNAIRIHKTLGPGHHPEIYVNALAISLSKASHQVDMAVDLPVYYEEYLVGHHRADLIIDAHCLVSVSSNLPLKPQVTLQRIIANSPYGVALQLDFSQEKMVNGIRRVSKRD